MSDKTQWPKVTARYRPITYGAALWSYEDSSCERALHLCAFGVAANINLAFSGSIRAANYSRFTLDRDSRWIGLGYDAWLWTNAGSAFLLVQRLLSDCCDFRKSVDESDLKINSELSFSPDVTLRTLRIKIQFEASQALLAGNFFLKMNVSFNLVVPNWPARIISFYILADISLILVLL